MPDRPKLIALFTDFGLNGPYQGQMAAVLAAAGVVQPLVNLMSDAPRFDPKSSAYLLAALADGMPAGTLFISVVDPGVGGDRRPIIVTDSGQWFVGPDNGLLSQVARRSGTAQAELIEWRPERLSNSFHGRDLFAPVAAAICNMEYIHGKAISLDSLVGVDWPDDLAQVIYVDAFGNAISGIDASSVKDGATLSIGNTRVQAVATFSQVSAGTAFWYENSFGLIEIAVNQGSANEQLGLEIGSPVQIHY
jgi:S-adenosyl-L-methionine hydrolase (adenosine-forming)